MALRPGRVQFVLGGVNLEPVEAMDLMMSKTKALGKALGELTRPFDEIAPGLISRIQKRFDSGAYGKPPYQDPARLTVGPFSPNKNRSKYTRLVRKARGQDPDGPALKASGELQKGIKRRRGPTSIEGEGSREVASLRIGLKGGARRKGAAHLGWGDTQWEVPVKVHPKTRRAYLDAAQFTSNPTSIYSNWKHIATYRDDTRIVEIPTRNFFLMSSTDKAFVTRVINKWFKKVVETQGKGGGR